MTTVALRQQCLDKLEAMLVCGDPANWIGRDFFAYEESQAWHRDRFLMEHTIEVCDMLDGTSTMLKDFQAAGIA